MDEKEVKGHIAVCLKPSSVNKFREFSKKVGCAYVVDTYRPNARYYVIAESLSGEPVNIEETTAAEIIEALTADFPTAEEIASTYSEEEVLSLWASRPNQEDLQRVWNKYDLWRYFIFVSNRPKPKPKPKPKPTRIASALAGAIRSSALLNDDETSRLAMPADTKRLLMVLAQYVPKGASAYGPDLFGTWLKIGLKLETLRSMARNIYGKSGPQQLRSLLQSLCRAAATSVTNVRLVEKPTKDAKPRRGSISIEAGSFIGVHDLHYQCDAEGNMEFDIPQDLDISLHNIFGYWISRFYGEADVQALVDRSRAKNGMEYMTIRLWGLENAPKISTATKTGDHEEIFPLAELNTGATNQYTDDDRRARCIAVAAEAAKDMGATYIGPKIEIGKGGQQTFVGLRFVWPKSLQSIDAKSPSNEKE